MKKELGDLEAELLVLGHTLEALGAQEQELLCLVDSSDHTQGGQVGSLSWWAEGGGREGKGRGESRMTVGGGAGEEWRERKKEQKRAGRKRKDKGTKRPNGGFRRQHRHSLCD